LDLAGLKNELFLIEQQLVNMRVKSHVMHEQLEMLETQSTHLEGVTLYLRGKLRDAGEDIGNDSKTLPDLNKL
jgi:hypothetical protein|tara:strand:+ start:350 stop:568 length:219 start_codon:yes stop_codon:yes gene_type:complete